MRRFLTCLILLVAVAALVRGCPWSGRVEPDPEGKPASASRAPRSEKTVGDAGDGGDAGDASRVQGGPDSTQPASSPTEKRSVQPTDVSVLEQFGIRLVYVVPGSFQAGSADRTDPRMEDEYPVRELQITEPFLIGETEITRRQWQRVMGTRMIDESQADLPMTAITFRDARDFCVRASKYTTHTVRLPTEIEWEYASRAGTTTEYSFGNILQADQACFSDGLYARSTGPVVVKQFEANPWGLYDMHGNVWEWCLSDLSKSDSEKQALQIARGGAWNYDAIDCRSGSRHTFAANIRSVHIGLRVAVD